MEQEQETPFDPREIILRGIEETGMGDELPVDFNVRYNQTDSRVLSLIDRLATEHPELEHWKLWTSHLNSTTFLTEWMYFWWINEIELRYEIDEAFVAKRNFQLLNDLASIRSYLIFRLTDAFEGHRAKLITEKSARLQYLWPSGSQPRKRRFGLF